MTQRILLILLFLNLSFCAFAQMKTWWFFGYERTGKEGIVADITALKDAGFSGVVYYDQNHATDARANGAEEGRNSLYAQHPTYPFRKRGTTLPEGSMQSTGAIQSGRASNRFGGR